MVPLHPALVHVPLGLALALPVVLLAITIATFMRKAGPRALWIAALLQAIVVAGGIVALASGRAEEERVEKIVADAALDRHETLATVFVIGAGVTLALVVAAAVVRERWSRVVAIVGTAASVGVLGLGAATGHAGGQLVYRDGAASAYATPAGAGANEGANAAGPGGAGGGAAGAGAKPEDD